MRPFAVSTASTCFLLVGDKVDSSSSTGGGVERLFQGPSGSVRRLDAGRRQTAGAAVWNRPTRRDVPHRLELGRRRLHVGRERSGRWVPHRVPAASARGRPAVVRQ